MRNNHKAATRMLYAAAGYPMVDNIEMMTGYCWLCGEQISKGVNKNLAIKDTFMDIDKAVSPDSTHWCNGCAWTFSEQDEMLTKKSKRFWCDEKPALLANIDRIVAWQKKNKSNDIPSSVDIGLSKIWGGFAIPQRMRTYSHFVVGGEWLLFSKANKAEMREILFDPPQSEWLGVIADSGQKHIIFRASVSFGRACSVQFEEKQITFDTDELIDIYASVDALYQNDFTKNEIETGNYSSTRIMKFGLTNWQVLEGKAQSFRGSALFGLAIFLLTKKNEDMENRIEQEQMIHQMCVNLLMLIHLSMDWSIWGSKRLKYWEIFQENVASAAYTDKISKWLSTICARMSIGTPGRKEEDRAMLFDIMSAGHDDAILEHLRSATQLCILEVRIAQQEKREVREQAAIEKIETSDAQSADLFAKTEVIQ